MAKYKAGGYSTGYLKGLQLRQREDQIAANRAENQRRYDSETARRSQIQSIRDTRNSFIDQRNARLDQQNVDTRDENQRKYDIQQSRIDKLDQKNEAIYKQKLEQGKAINHINRLNDFHSLINCALTCFSHHP